MPVTVEVQSRRSSTLALAAFLAVTAALLSWAKWAPYSVKVPAVASSGDLGVSVITGGAARPPEVSLSAGVQFARDYFLAIWPALVAGLVIAAAVQAVLPRQWLTRVLGGDGVAAGARGGVLSLPSLMCSCCAAPVAVGLRRARVSIPAALTFWLGNPALNPVVLVFAAFVLPWPWVVLRAAGGVLVVAGALAVARRVAGSGPVLAPAGTGGAEDESSDAPGQLASRLARLAVRILPEYVLLVVALGAVRGVLFDVSPGAAVTGLAVAALVAAGMLLPVPTGAEVAVVAALLAAGTGGVAAGALLVTLPVLSLPSLLMVRQVFPARVLGGVVAVVALVGLLCAAVGATL